MLNDAYTSMGKEERQSLLHEGVSATTTLSAWGKCIDHFNVDVSD